MVYVTGRCISALSNHRPNIIHYLSLVPQTCAKLISIHHHAFIQLPRTKSVSFTRTSRSQLQFQVQRTHCLFDRSIFYLQWSIEPAVFDISFFLFIISLLDSQPVYCTVIQCCAVSTCSFGTQSSWICQNTNFLPFSFHLWTGLKCIQSALELESLNFCVCMCCI